MVFLDDALNLFSQGLDAILQRPALLRQAGQNLANAGWPIAGAWGRQHFDHLADRVFMAHRKHFPVGSGAKQASELPLTPHARGSTTFAKQRESQAVGLSRNDQFAE
jgi:hypothetical protein